MTDRERPNIILIHWHDLGRHLGAYGLEWVDSPNVDALAADGVRFDEAHCAAPLCSPARGAMMTGRYPHANGLMGLAHLGWSYRAGERTLASRLGEEGYRTALIGHQHESDDPRTLGYDEVQDARRPGEQHYCDVVTDRAVSWLENAHRHRTPFFASIGFFEVHRPYPGELYPPDDPHTVDVPAWLPDNEHVRADLAGLQSAIRIADRAVGRILDALDRTGLDRTTWVIFTTDHGLAFPGAKSTLFDRGTSVALIQRLPRAWGVEPGVCTELVSHVDLVPTVLEVIGAEPDPTVHGTSHAQWLLDRTPTHADAVYTEKTYHDDYDPMRAIRTDRYKLIVNYEQRPTLLLPKDIEDSPSRAGIGEDHLQPRAEVELYDLVEDPLESVNLAADPAYAEVLRDLSERLRAWQERTDDPLLAGAIAQPVRA
ncbi:sulfatase [Microbacterium awajiense]|uniref:Sulfatase n=1 Tax=Microbacterium awajiense TaxID=415214 RepID=A0ABP7AQ20_9MICO